MAAAKKPGGRGRGGDGLEYLGISDGKKWWLARINYTDPRTGKKKAPTAKFTAPNRHLAQQQRLARIEKKKRGAASGDGKRHRMKEAIQLYLDAIPVHSTSEVHGSCARVHLLPKFGEWFIDMVTEREMQHYLDAHPQSVAQRRVLRQMLQRAFDKAIAQGWATTNEAKGLRVLERREKGQKKGLPPKRALSLDEAVSYLADVKAHEPHCTYLMLHTQLVLGCRFGEITDLTWEDVDLESGFVTIAHAQYKGHEGDTKGKYARPSAIDLGLRAELAEHRREMASHQWPGWETLVFPRPWNPRKPRKSNHMAESTIYWAIKRSLKRLGLVLRVGSHLARHTMANVAREHASALLLRKVMGHQSESVQLTYTAAERAEIINLADRVGGALRTRSAPKSVPSGSGERGES